MFLLGTFPWTTIKNHGLIWVFKTNWLVSFSAVITIGDLDSHNSKRFFSLIKTASTVYNWTRVYRNRHILQYGSTSLDWQSSQRVLVVQCNSSEPKQKRWGLTKSHQHEQFRQLLGFWHHRSCFMFFYKIQVRHAETPTLYISTTQQALPLRNLQLTGSVLSCQWGTCDSLLTAYLWGGKEKQRGQGRRDGSEYQRIELHFQGSLFYRWPSQNNQNRDSRKQTALDTHHDEGLLFTKWWRRRWEYVSEF